MAKQYSRMSSVADLQIAGGTELREATATPSAIADRPLPHAVIRSLAQHAEVLQSDLLPSLWLVAYDADRMAATVPEICRLVEDAWETLPAVAESTPDFYVFKTGLDTDDLSLFTAAGAEGVDVTHEAYRDDPRQNTPAAYILARLEDILACDLPVTTPLPAAERPPSPAPQAQDWDTLRHFGIVSRPDGQ